MCEINYGLTFFDAFSLICVWWSNCQTYKLLADAACKQMAVVQDTPAKCCGASFCAETRIENQAASVLRLQQDVLPVAVSCGQLMSLVVKRICRGSLTEGLS